jgi:hypothetical protein
MKSVNQMRMQQRGSEQERERERERERGCTHIYPRNKERDKSRGIKIKEILKMGQEGRWNERTGYD